MGTNLPAPVGRPRASRGAWRPAAAGFSLVELLVSLFLISVAIVAMASMVSAGGFVNYTAANLTSVTTMASDRVAELSSMQYAQLAVGGSLTGDVAGFFERLDLDGDAVTDVTVRWVVTDLGAGKRIQVAATAEDATLADRQSITLAALVAKP